MKKYTLCFLLVTLMICGCTTTSKVKRTESKETEISSTEISSFVDAEPDKTSDNKEESSEEINFYDPALDADNNGILDYIEKMDLETDTDEDGLTDYQEISIIGTDPLLKDTDGNGLNDIDDDMDNDGLSNGYELSIGTSPNSIDSDGDGLGDFYEHKTLKTDPLNADTDKDGASDGWEISHDYNPLKFNKDFSASVQLKSQRVTASVQITASADTAQSLSVRKVKPDAMINETIPGYIDSAFEFEANGDIGIAVMSFQLDDELLNNPECVPTIYCLNEDNYSWYELETIIENNIAKAQITHFSKYILMDKTIYDRVMTASQKIDPVKAKAKEPDSNHDDINDYLTKMMCDGVIRTKTGALVFGSHTYEQVQQNDDLDGDGIINGEEVNITTDLYIPKEAVELNGHYYLRYDEGYVWDDANTFCLSVGGHLATITSAEEQEFVKSLVFAGSKNSYWLGARGHDRVFSWITGEDWVVDYGHYNNFSSSGYEDCLMMYRLDNPMYSIERAGMWNDLNHYAVCGNEPFFGINNFGLVCEWEDVDGDLYINLNSSPVETDSDHDGFPDNIDPTPYYPEAFASISDYKKYYYDDEITVTLFVKQPAWDSRLAYTNNLQESDYFQFGGSGHSYLGIDYEDESQYYFGFYGNTGVDSSPQIQAVMGKVYPGFILGEMKVSENGTYKRSFSDGIPEFTIAKTFVVTKEQLEAIMEYADKHKNDNYYLSSYNCTTFAVNALKNAGLCEGITEHKWQTDVNALLYYLVQVTKISNYINKPTIEKLFSDDLIKEIQNTIFYGYSPADTAQDIKESYDGYLTKRKYKLRNPNPDDDPDNAKTIDAYEYITKKH